MKLKKKIPAVKLKKKTHAVKAKKKIPTVKLKKKTPVVKVKKKTSAVKPKKKTPVTQKRQQDVIRKLQKQIKILQENQKLMQERLDAVSKEASIYAELLEIKKHKPKPIVEITPVPVRQPVYIKKFDKHEEQELKNSIETDAGDEDYPSAKRKMLSIEKALKYWIKEKAIEKDRFIKSKIKKSHSAKLYLLMEKREKHKEDELPVEYLKVIKVSTKKSLSKMDLKKRLPSILRSLHKNFNKHSETSEYMYRIKKLLVMQRLDK